MRTWATLLTAVALLAGAVFPAAAQDAPEPTVASTVVESFDGTPLYTTLFLPAGASEDSPVPLVMRGHGWGGNGERTAIGMVELLLDAGYAVLTWDERGFGYSGGEAHVLKPELEGRDAQVLIDWVVENAPEVARDGDDPVIGMTGGSYGGGIQTLLSHLDDRVDAIAPEITWSDLRYSLYENEVINLAWGQLLYGAGLATATAAGLDPQNPAGPQAGGLAAELHRAQAEGDGLNEFSEQTREFFARSSLVHYAAADPISVPTLVMQGSVDTLFDLSEGNDIYQHVKATGAPARYVIFCGGHVACPAEYADADDREYLDAAILAWFDRHLRGADVDTGPPVTYRTNEGVWRHADDFGPRGRRRLSGSGSGSIAQTGAPVSASAPNPVTAEPSADGDPRMLSVEVAAADDGPLELVGLPQLELTVAGEGTEAILFAKLVDRESGHVVNLQETPLRVRDLGEAQSFELTMSGIAYTLPESHHLDLQIATNSVMHANARTPAQLEVAAAVSVPVLPAARPDAPPVASGGGAGPGGTAEGLPATGGGAATLAPLAFGAGVVLRRRR